MWFLECAMECDFWFICLSLSHSLLHQEGQFPEGKNCILFSIVSPEANMVPDMTLSVYVNWEEKKK